MVHDPSNHSRSFFSLVILAISTCLGLGFIPRGSATLGSIFGALLYLFFMATNPFSASLVVILIALSIGIFICGQASKIFDDPDPKQVVYDEMVGVWTVFLFVPINLISILFGILVFRIFDKFKWLGIRQIQFLKSGWGIMLDDIAAGLYAGIVLFLAKSIYEKLT